eukprot:6716628-Prorocentrum_lima.AAC.1
MDAGEQLATSRADPAAHHLRSQGAVLVAGPAVTGQSCGSSCREVAVGAVVATDHRGNNSRRSQKCISRRSV